jgi:hypothetical protein
MEDPESVRMEAMYIPVDVEAYISDDVYENEGEDR